MPAIPHMADRDRYQRGGDSTGTWSSPCGGDHRYGGSVLNIIAQTAYPYSAASARVRIAGFAPVLAELGIELHYRPTLTETQYAAVGDGHPSAARLAALVASAAPVARAPRATSAGLLLVHRLRSLLPIPFLEFAPRIDAYDFDDAMFAAADLGTGIGPRLVKAEAHRWARYVRAARLVIAGNAYLASAARERARRVEVVPSCVDSTRYALREHRDQPVVTIGWVGSRTTSPFLVPVLPAVERLNRDRLRARLVVVGGGSLPAVRGLEQRAWSLHREAADFAEFDIGIMPLPDNQWTRGKCGYKVLQYFAAGVPVVASPVGVNAGLIGTDRGRLVSSEGDWYAALRELIGDVAARRQMGEAGRQLVASDYSYQRWGPELAEMLRSLVG